MFWNIFLLILGFGFLIAGLIGCILPIIPGPPLSYIALLTLQVTRFASFSAKFLLIATIVTVIVTVLDYIFPVWSTNKFGGSRSGTIGTIVGLVFGLFFLPWGIIAGSFTGAVVGELIAGRNTNTALRSGFGSFIGLLFGVAMKLTVSAVFTYYFIKELIV